MKAEAPKFIADINVGKLARLLRLIGYNTLVFKGMDDADMLVAGMAEDRIILTRDTRIMKRRLVTGGEVRTVLIQSDQPGIQLAQVIENLNLPRDFKPFTICLECNEPLVAKEKEAVKDTVPAYVYETQEKYTACPCCGRIYWRGTHWQAMMAQLQNLKEANTYSEG
ncbi:MAG: Mut7-C RNAse domain-containing protein [Chloroflexota bacterium]